MHGMECETVSSSHVGVREVTFTREIPLNLAPYKAGRCLERDQNV